MAFALLKKLKGKADIGPRLSKCCKSRYFIVYLHVVNHAISTEIFYEKSRCNEEKIKSHPVTKHRTELFPFSLTVAVMILYFTHRVFLIAFFPGSTGVCNTYPPSLGIISSLLTTYSY